MRVWEMGDWPGEKWEMGDEAAKVGDSQSGRWETEIFRHIFSIGNP